MKKALIYISLAIVAGLLFWLFIQPLLRLDRYYCIHDFFMLFFGFLIGGAVVFIKTTFYED